jgi:hypothetical protein
MFISTNKKVPTFNVGQEMQRRDISTGHVFRYTTSSREGYLYAHLDEYHNVYYALKFPRNAPVSPAGMKEKDATSALNFTSTPIHSGRVEDRVEIVGHFEFNVELNQTPRLCTIGAIKDAQTVVSLREDVDDNGYPHLYLVLGRTHTQTPGTADATILIKLTKDTSVNQSRWVAIRELNNLTMVAVRGVANVTIYDGGE